MTAENWYRDLFRIDSSQISALLFVRVAIAVGAPLLGFALAGHLTAAIAGGATALFVSLSDIGRTRRGRAGTMALTTVVILLGGFVGDKFGLTTWADEALIVELVRESSVPPSMLVLTRLYDVGVGCVIVLVATLVATLVAGIGHRNT